jgi:hypothetical protein
MDPALVHGGPCPPAVQAMTAEEAERHKAAAHVTLATVRHEVCLVCLVRELACGSCLVRCLECPVPLSALA